MDSWFVPCRDDAPTRSVAAILPRGSAQSAVPGARAYWQIGCLVRLAYFGSDLRAARLDTVRCTNAVNTTTDQASDGTRSRRYGVTSTRTLREYPVAQT